MATTKKIIKENISIGNQILQSDWNEVSFKFGRHPHVAAYVTTKFMLQCINLLLCQNSFPSEGTKTPDLTSVNYVILRWWEWSTTGWDINSGNLHGIADPLRDIAFRELQNHIETRIFYISCFEYDKKFRSLCDNRMIHTTAVSKQFNCPLSRLKHLIGQ